jgi:hypothetical protein
MRRLLKELEQQYLGYPHPVVEGYVLGVIVAPRGSAGAIAGISDMPNAVPA